MSERGFEPLSPGAPITVELKAPSGERYVAELGQVVAETPSTLLHDARIVLEPGQPLPAGLAAPGPLGAPSDHLVIKRGRHPADFGRLDLERVACERLEHPGIARFLGASRELPLGTVLAFERLAPNPLLLLDTVGLRPAFRDPGTRWFPLPPGVALELAHDVLEALEHVHACGFVHGGVSVGNLLVRTPPSAADGGGEWRRDALAHVAEGDYQGVLAGLGGAREVTFLDALRRGAVDPELTPRPPVALAAPEALIERPELGGRLVWSPAMDAYAFGLLLYSLLTGRSAYDHVCKPADLASELVVNELKLRETRGEVSPADPGAIATVPLHDSPFAVPQEDGWPRFHSTVRHVLARCLDPDPRSRMTVAAARLELARELHLRRAVDGSWRRTTQHLFQMLPGSNRLRGDGPGRGIWVLEEDGGLVVGEPPQDLAREPQGELLEGSLAAGLSITIKPAREPAPATPQRARRLPEPIRLRDVVRAFHAGKPLPVSPPCLLTTLELDPRELARCVVHSLGGATGRIVVSDGDVHEELRLVVGRTSDNDIVVADPQVSKRHAALGFDRARGHWYVEDLRSANGTTLDSEPVAAGKRARIKSIPALLELGASARLTFVGKDELDAFLKRIVGVLEATKAAADAKAAPPATPIADGFTDELPDPDKTARVDIERAPAPFEPAASFATATRRIQRPKPPIEFPLVPAGDRRPHLVRQVEEHGKAGAAFRIVLTGAVVKNAANVAEALKVLRSSISDVVRLEAEYPDRKVDVYRRPS